MPESNCQNNVEIYDDTDENCCCSCFKKPRKTCKTENFARVNRSNMMDFDDDFVHIEQKELIFSQDLPKEKPIGTTVCVKGRILPNCSRFSINFECNVNKNDEIDPDIALHFNPRLHQRYIVVTHRINGRWADEDTYTINGYDLEFNREFDIKFLVSTKDEILIAINDRHCCSYRINNKFQLEQIQKMVIRGPIDDHRIEIKQLNIYTDPEIIKSRMRNVSKHNEFGDTIMTTPVMFSLREGLQRDHQLEIYGKVKILPHSFYLNLQEGCQNWPHPNIPLHLNPRFYPAKGEHVFISNAWIDGGWGQEERTPCYHFAPGSKFTMSIKLGDRYFRVSINGKLIGEFKLRTSIDKIDTLYICGDVVIYGVVLNKN